MSDAVGAGLTVRSHKGPYDVLFGDRAAAGLDALAAGGRPLHVIVDERVADLHGDRLAPLLAGPSVLRLAATETNKSLEKFPAYVDHLVATGIRRDHLLVAVGGGIIQDITCFLAATMLRGVEWAFCPTTLLAQADSCIGSKSSINSAAAKNILGTFTPPRTIYLDVAFQATLDARDVRSGIGEILKVHAIDGPESFAVIAADYDRLFTEPDVMLRYVRAALEIKKAYIEEDEFDRGPRNIFNYGHTFGHAIEAATEFAIPHGIAVTIGMDMANFVATRVGDGSEDHFRRLRPTLAANYEGFQSHPVPFDAFLGAILKDKKNTGAGSVTMILPGADGRLAKVTHAADDAFTSACRTFLEEVRPA
ncbi:MAG: 3-dehydroquinate synthase [Rhodospirillales bacterium CG15_BIG_FIL_POST_REV_8_21_14_020_66_15]|nr:MAG: 3-dehydroquinate synthase [Rhodospirillales bacterium CG15_BIG_FIL_POST_REV_8_21_14_020_66_15]